MRHQPDSHNEHTRLRQACLAMMQAFPDEVCLIGGTAVRAYTAQSSAPCEIAGVAEDIDMYVSLPVFGTLRNEENLVSNERLARHHMRWRNLDFDIYTERLCNLIIPFDEVMARSQVFDGLRVACLEHLLVLKTLAYQDRKGSDKGEKDARDLLRIACAIKERGEAFHPELVAPYLGLREMDLLCPIGKSPVVMAMAEGNSHEAKKLREIWQDTLEALDRQVRLDEEKSRKPKP